MSEPKKIEINGELAEALQELNSKVDSYEATIATLSQLAGDVRRSYWESIYSAHPEARGRDCSYNSKTMTLTIFDESA